MKRGLFLIALLGMMVGTAQIGTAGTIKAIDRATAIKVVNSMRAERGLRPMAYSNTLQAVARQHAADMARNNFFGHRGSNGSSLRQRIKARGYNFCAAAENLAYGSSTTTRAIAQWRRSAGHYRNIVGSKYREFGMARAAGNKWVMVVGTRRGKC